MNITHKLPSLGWHKSVIDYSKHNTSKGTANMFTDLMLPACLPDASERLLREGEGCQSESLLSET
jgi:hypothetical protein